MNPEKKLVLFLFAKFEAIYGEKWLGRFDSKEKLSLGFETWGKYISHMAPENLEKVILICERECVWPPSIAELLKIIDIVEGVPTWEEALQHAVRKNYIHPAIEMARKKVGSFAMQNDFEKNLMPKFRKAYSEALAECRGQNINKVRLGRVQISQTETSNAN